MSLVAPKHGYNVIQEIKEWTSGEVILAAGTMYSALENLLKKGWIVAIESDDKRRKIYELTEQGVEVVSKDYNRMLRNVELYQNVVSKKGGRNNV
ncbi:PadR family transcriptional regulator [Enterococcus ratti]|uniref:Transcriptional regulator n=1 Tax=Enterococcus ratti TaxID=150033 RepID=A0A1L8WR79_9ENTE|nr:transcriptional regulator [Enterococcus ratti]